MPRPIDINAITIINNGRVITYTFILENIPIPAINVINNNSLIPNWNKFDAVIESGTIALGKYTFPNIPWFALKVLEVPVNEV
jgi:hypothetical protein